MQRNAMQRNAMQCMCVCVFAAFACLTVHAWFWETPNLTPGQWEIPKDS